MSDNLPEVLADLKAWQNRMDKAGELATREISIALWTDARKIASETPNPPIQKNNRLRHNPHIGPRSGEGPNIATGNLFRNIIAQPVRHQGFGTYVASVESGAEYARVVEQGSSNWNGVKYPYMTPARENLIATGKAQMIASGFFRAAMGV